MDHQDIMDLIEAGELSAAYELFNQRKAKGGISGQDAATLTFAYEKALAASTEAPAEEPVAEDADSEPEPKAEESVATSPRRSAGRKG